MLAGRGCPWKRSGPPALPEVGSSYSNKAHTCALTDGVQKLQPRVSAHLLGYSLLTTKVDPGMWKSGPHLCGQTAPFKFLEPIEPGEMIGVVDEVRDRLPLGPTYGVDRFLAARKAAAQ